MGGQLGEGQNQSPAQPSFRKALTNEVLRQGGGGADLRTHLLGGSCF